MKKILLYCMFLSLLLSGCTKEPSSHESLNKPPRTYLWLFPDSTIREGNSKQHIRWWGDDPDGIIKGYLFASDTNKLYDSLGRLLSPNNMTWRWRTGNDTNIAFPLQKKRQTFYVAVRAVDNTFTTDLPDQALIHFTPTCIYYDVHENDTLDADDVVLTFPNNSIDPKGATLGMPLLNQPPSVTFAPNPTNPAIQFLQPETTYTAATFAWVGTDPDGDNTIAWYRFALNNPTDPSKWITVRSISVTIRGSDYGLSGNIAMITLFVPRTRSDTATTNEVTADLYSNKFITRQNVASIPGLKLDTLNTFYLQAIDIAGDTSKIIQMPDPGKTWFVKKPKSRLLAIIDYINSDSTQASNTYKAAFAQINLPTGSLANYDELNIGRGISTEEKKNAAAGLSNPKFGVLVPPFIDPALIYTFYLFDYVFWYTDIYPCIPVAQLTVPRYVSIKFNGQNGKVIFSTSFETNPDPRGLLPYFAPIDSISSVILDPAAGTRLLPSLGDSQIPGEYQVVPDSSDLSDIFPMLKFNIKYRHSVYLRPLYRRADARYIYHIQDDTRIPIRYAYTATLSELKSAALAGTSITSCGTNGIILNSIDKGISWSIQKSGTTFSLNAIKFSNSFNGIIVGDTGTVLQTNDGGISWSNYSRKTFKNILGVDFPTDTLALAVGTKGLLIRSSDKGVNWEFYSSPTSKTLRAVKFIDANNGIAVGDSAIVKTTDGGYTWRSINGIPLHPYNDVAYRDPSTVFAVSSALYIGGSGILLRSDDAGDTWSQAGTLVGDLRSIHFSDASNGWICGTNGRIYRTTNGGINWSGVISGVTQNLNELSFLDANEGWCIGSGAVILHTLDGGLSWSTQPKGNINVAVIDGTKSFVFIGLPLHLLNGDGNNVKSFLEYVILKEFIQ